MALMLWLCACSVVVLPRSLLAKDEIAVAVYTGYGTPSSIFLSGRVLVDKGLAAPDPQRSSMSNLADALRRLESDEVAGVEVVVSVGWHSWIRQTDDDGLWSVDAKGLKPPLTPGRHPVRVQLNSKSGEPTGSGSVVVLSSEAGVAVVSDYDDTVVHSYVTDKVQMVKQALLRNPAQLLPVSGVVETYQAAERAGAAVFFYLSGSPQNFYERINDFLRLHELPRGPLLLKNFGDDPLFAQEEYKIRHIEELIGRLPNVKLVLIGDSGERDPEVFAKIAAEHPNRIIGILIRRVEGDESPASRFENMHVVSDYSESVTLVAGWVRSATRTKAPQDASLP
jgi:phosphatidate phosphatase APP1